MSHLISHLDGAPTTTGQPSNGNVLAGVGADSSTPGVTSVVPAPMPSPTQALGKSILIVGAIALIAYGVCRAVRK